MSLENQILNIVDTACHDWMEAINITEASNKVKEATNQIMRLIAKERKNK